MREIKGYPLPLGISERNGIVNFSVEVDSGKKCNLCIYKKGEELPEIVIELQKENSVGDVRFTALPTSKLKSREYNYEIDGIKQLDSYVKAYMTNAQTGEVRGRILMDSYDWENDRPLNIPNHEVIAYSLHVRGFTNHRSSKVRNTGTFLGLVKKILYKLIKNTISMKNDKIAIIILKTVPPFILKLYINISTLHLNFFI